MAASARRVSRSAARAGVVRQASAARNLSVARKPQYYQVFDRPSLPPRQGGAPASFGLNEADKAGGAGRNAPRPMSFPVGWLELQERRLVLFGQHVEQPVGPLADVADALVQIAQQRLAAQLVPVVVEHNPLQLAGTGNLALPHAAHEQVALPVRKAVAGVERHSRP